MQRYKLSACGCELLLFLILSFANQMHSDLKAMNLIIDTGNTLTKLALFQDWEMVAFTSIKGLNADQLIQFCEANPLITNTILSSVKDYPEEIDKFLAGKYNTVHFTPDTTVPVQNKYGTPETLGKDRLAGVVGAQRLFPNTDVLVIDAGTAITYDIVTSANEYMGGAISPGLAMRYKALNAFTGRLPLVDYYDDAALIGDSTATSIYSGVLNGALAEMEGIIQRYQLTFPDIKIILTGGDYNYFDKKLKIKTFAAPNLVLEGLNLILNFNIGTR